MADGSNMDPSLRLEIGTYFLAMKIDWRYRKGNGVSRTLSRSRRSGFARSGGVRFAADQQRAGSALLLVLFAIILLSGLITATVAFVSNDVDEYGALNKEFRARQLAESGLAFGSPQVKNQDRRCSTRRCRIKAGFTF